MPQARAMLEEVSDLVERLMPRIQERRYDITWKTDGSPVTEADLLVEREISQLLERRTGGLTFLGEETFASQPGASDGWTAVLDPIDGTENFCSGLKEWGVSLSLWCDGEHEGSMLLLPELDERLITGDELELRHSRITGFSSSMSDGLVQEVSRTAQARIIGCAVYNLFNVISGSYRRFFNPVGAYSWDLLAGVQLALEHGHEVTIDGEPYDGRFLEPGRKYRVDIRHGLDHRSGKGAISGRG